MAADVDAEGLRETAERAEGEMVSVRTDGRNLPVLQARDSANGQSRRRRD